MIPFRHCPGCGEPLGEPEGNVQRCAACGRDSYHNAAPTACAIVVDQQGRVLLGRRSRPPDAGLWDLPGGYVDLGETPEACVVRELREETGLEVEVGRYVTTFADRYGEGGADGPETLNLVFEARVVGPGRGVPADDVSELRWFALDELPGAREFAFAGVWPALRGWLSAAPGR